MSIPTNRHDPVRIVDAHQHLWRIGGPGQSWPDAGWPRLHRDFLLPDLHAAVAGLNVVATVLVQSQPDDRDTDWMFAEATTDPLVGAIVGWVDLAAPTAPGRIAALARRPKMRGVRPMLQAIADTDWILRDELAPAVGALCAEGLRFDALVQPRHLSALATFARRWPDLPIVIDHAAKPAAATGALDPWRADLAALAKLPNVWCKLSGLRTEQAAGQASELLAPYVEHLLALFPDRLMWGSDWPVLLDSGDSYGDWVRTADALTGRTGPARDDLFAGAAARFYDLALPGD